MSLILASSFARPFAASLNDLQPAGHDPLRSKRYDAAVTPGLLLPNRAATLEKGTMAFVMFGQPIKASEDSCARLSSF